MNEPHRSTMSAAQLSAIRLLELTLIKTILTGDLHVRDDAGTDWLLNQAGELETYDLQRNPREPA
jgi:hypothetical protein